MDQEGVLILFQELSHLLGPGRMRRAGKAFPVLGTAELALEQHPSASDNIPGLYDPGVCGAQLLCLVDVLGVIGHGPTFQSLVFLYSLSVKGVFKHSGSDAAKRKHLTGFTQRSKVSPRPQRIFGCGFMNENELSKVIVDSCLKVHKAMGSGLLESVYEKALAYELERRRLNCTRQVNVTAFYDGKDMGLAFRADIIVEDKVILEIKSIENLLPVHKKQLLTYLRHTDIKLGLLINFNVPLIKDGITRVVNKL